MIIALVYYSLDGNTAFAAEKIGLKLGADIHRLKPVKRLALRQRLCLPGVQPPPAPAP